jgi:hypothetical protein
MAKMQEHFSAMALTLRAASPCKSAVLPICVLAVRACDVTPEVSSA